MRNIVHTSLSHVNFYLLATYKYGLSVKVTKITLRASVVVNRQTVVLLLVMWNNSTIFIFCLRVMETVILKVMSLYFKQDILACTQESNDKLNFK